MKKFIKMLSVIGIAVIGVIVSSCQVEDINTTFESKNAVAEITVSAFDLTTGNDVTGSSELKLTASSTANNPISITGNVLKIEGTPAIAEQTVTIFAEYKGQTGSATVKIKSILAGGKYGCGATVVIGSVAYKSTATVQISVWDKTSGKDVTADAAIALEGIPAGCILEGEKGSYKITSTQAISAFILKAKAVYNGETKQNTVLISDIKLNETKHFSSSFTFEREAVVEPAVANIVVTVKDLNLNKEVTDLAVISAVLSDDSNATVKTVGNVVTVTAGDDLKIAAQSVTITAQYDNRTETTEVALSKIPANTVGNYATTVFFQKDKPCAFALVQVSVWDNTSGKDVTADAAIALEGVPAGCTLTGENGSYVISGIEAIPSFTLNVSASYKGETETKKIIVHRIEAGQVKDYKVDFEVGTTPIVEDPAVANITVSVKDNNLGLDVTDKATITATLAQGSTATVSTLGNVIRVTAGDDLKIAAQTVNIHIVYAAEAKDVEFLLSEVAAGTVGNYSLTVEYNKVAYLISKINSEETVEVGTFFSTHNLHTYTHNYSHDYGHGHVSGQWLYNETEFILETIIDYSDIRGIVKREIIYAADATEKDKLEVDHLALPYAENWIETPEQLEVKVSAFARYSAYATRITTTDTYNVSRVVNSDAANAVSVGTIIVNTIATAAEYCEAAMPGHEGHYVHGHGHADEHGYSSNAGGGIVWAE